MNGDCIKMEYGIMLPTLDRNFNIDDELNRLNQLKNINKLRIWFRDLPATQKIDSDEGIAMDPLLAIQYVLSKYGFLKLGIGVLNTSFRNIMLTIRELITLGNLVNTENLIIGVGSGEKELLFKDSNISWSEKSLNFEFWLTEYNHHFNNLEQNGRINLKNHYYSMGALKQIPRLAVATKNIDMVNKFDKLIDSNIIWLSNLEDISKLKQKIKNKKLIMFLPISINNAVKKIEIIQFEDRDILVMTEEILKLYLRELEKSGVNEVIFSIIPGSNLNFLDNLYQF